MNPSFVVPAEDFYALTAHLPLEVTADTRYRIACLQDERQTRDLITAAAARGVIASAPSPVLAPGPGVTAAQAARRLRALGRTKGSPDCKVVAGSDLETLIEKWLDFNNPTPNDDPELDIEPFWGPNAAAHPQGHLRLVLCAATQTADVEPLIAAIGAVAPIGSVTDLVAITATQWNQIFHANPALLPEFTKPGTLQERIDAFIRHLERFFDLTITGNIFAPAPPAPVPTFGTPVDDPLSQFFARYAVNAGAPFAFGSAPVPAAIQAAAEDVFPDNERAQRWLADVAVGLNELFTLTDIGVPPELQISLMEALWARGFTRVASVADLAFQDFVDALIGTVAFDHAAAIYAKSGGPSGPGATPPGPVQPVNPDGTLVNCVPPPHLSPLGPVAYLHDMLRVTREGRCDAPQQGAGTLADALKTRRGPLGDLHVTRANLDVPLPLIDLVNECLEALAANAPAKVSGVVYDTATTTLNGHTLGGAAGHDRTVLLAALPEHSSPAVPVEEPGAYDKLRQAFSDPLLPYSQPLDIDRTYLRGVATSRYAVMRRFRKLITEFVLDPANEPAGFRAHLWRYPVRFEIAREYLGIDPEEDAIFVHDIAAPLLAELYGFSAADPAWMSKAIHLPAFLKATGLEYCDLFELWLSKFVPFTLKEIAHGMAEGDRPGSGRGGRTDDAAPPGRGRERRPIPADRGREDRRQPVSGFPKCPPCCLDEFVLEFPPPMTVALGLKELIVFVRLWRKLQRIPGAKYSFAQLRDICEVLGLFDTAGVVNPDFLRQLAAFQMLRDHLALELVDRYAAASGTGADRTHLLALWVGPAAAKWNWAVDHLLDQIRHYAVARHRCDSREPEFLKLLAGNLDPLSVLAGFDPAVAAETWHAHPTHTLRFAEVLAKIYASKFAIGEILFLFTTADHLGGDDPFPLQPPTEAVDDPLQLPDDEREHALWDLRKRLLDVSASEEEAAAWTWDRIDASLREEFGFPAAPAPDALRAFGEHFFPGLLEAAGHPVGAAQRQYRATLNTTSALMWNTPAEGPFRYDQAANELYTQIPIADEAVIAKISRVKPLSTDEQNAVRDVYFQPRVHLARFALLFPRFQEADERLIQEADEGKRWEYFQRSFAAFHARCRAIAEHLTAHVAAETGMRSQEGWPLAWRLLKHLLADENRGQTAWETDAGSPPAVTWSPLPSGGAFGAILGLLGGGVLGEMRVDGSNDVRWREVRGPLEAFGGAQNEWNAPVVPIIPSMTLTLTGAQLRFAGLRNGFALANVDGAPLGGAQGFQVTWRGVLLVESSGVHTFFAGSPTPDGEEPTLDCAEHQQWRITINRGQRTYVLLSHRWPGEVAPAQRSEPVPLRRGAYDLIVEFIECPPEFDDPEDITRQKTGFQVKYAGPDSADRIVTIPADRLFLKAKDAPLSHALSPDIAGEAFEFLRTRYVSTLRDVRRTYQRAFKALLFAHRFGLSARPVSDDLQSEIGYMLAHAEDFSGMSFFPQGGAFHAHRAWFDFNLLPVGDNYSPPAAAQDQRAQPSVKRERALFDWWERMFDYTELRTRANTGPEMPAWLLFHEAAENHPDDPAHALRHIGVDLSHADVVRRYYKQFLVSSANLEDERWAIRLWRADDWLESLRAHFTCVDVRQARPDLWAADDPGVIEPPDTVSGNAVLTRFVQDGYFENEEPRRYQELKTINDALRERGRDALLAFLCSMDRVPLPWGGHAHVPRDLTELLLIDVETGLCQRASRIEEAITAVQTFVQRARLRLEPSWVPGPELTPLWDRRFATFNIWHICKRRQVYMENWIEWEDLAEARRSEGFRFLEDRLRSATLTAPAPAGLVVWKDQRPPDHPGLQWLQVREPSWLTPIKPPREGFTLLGTEERDARPSWLSWPALGGGGGGRDVPAGIAANVDAVTLRAALPPAASGKLPWWIEAAIRLGVKFVRVAAAGQPMGSSMFEPEPHEGGCVTCCAECGVPHPPVVDEYYFWLLDSRYYDKVVQDANVIVAGGTSGESPWHDDSTLPKLLHWKSEAMVHLMWSRVHNGELKQTRRSAEGVRATGTPDLVFIGRFADSLRFEVSGGVAPPGYEPAPSPGFRYDLPTDSAEVLPPVVADPPVPGPFLTTFSGFPYFAYFEPGAPLVPLTFYSQAVTVASWLRAHCRFEAALKWYEAAFDPLHNDASWCPDTREPERPGDDGRGAPRSKAPGRTPRHVRRAPDGGGRQPARARPAPQRRLLQGRDDVLRGGAAPRDHARLPRNAPRMGGGDHAPPFARGVPSGAIDLRHRASDRG
jgi:ABC toxin-like protein